MADENKKTIIISAQDDSIEAIESVKKNFASLPKEIQKQYKMTSDGIAVSYRQMEASAKRSGRTMQEQMDIQIKAMRKFRDIRAQAADDERYAAMKTKEGGQQIGKIGKLAEGAAGGLAKMAMKSLSVAAAFETMREGYLAFAKYDTQLRRLQNSIGGSRSSIEGFGEMFKKVAMDTGDDLGQLQGAFKTFLDKSMISPADAKRIFPDIALYAKGAGASVDDMSTVAGDAMRNMSIPASDYKKVLESIVRVADDLNVDVAALAQGGSRMSEVMAALGINGAEGFAKMGTYVGIANRATGSTSQSIQILSNLMEKMLAGDKGLADALGMPVQVMLDNLEEAKKRGDPLGWMIGMFAKSNKQREIQQAVGIKDAKVVRELQRAYADVGTEIEKTANATEGWKKSRNMTEGAEVAVNRLTNSLSLLTMEVGHFLDAFGLTTGFTFFAKLFGDIARGAERLLSLLEAISRWEMPAWMPKSWLEFTHRFQRNILGQSYRPEWKDTIEGQAESKKATGYTGLSTDPVRPAESVPLSNRAPGQYEQNYSVGQRPGAPPAAGGGPVAEKISYRTRGTSGATEFSSQRRRRDPNIQNAAFTSEDNAKNIAKAIAKEQGGGYGSSMDAKYLRASYHPGGGGGGGFGSSGLNTGVYDQAGPTGSGGTGYGGGTDLAPAYEGGRQGRTGNGRADDSQAPDSTQAPGQQAPTTTDQPGGTASGNYKGKRVNADVMKTRIQQANAEWMKDPKNQQKIFRTLQAEGGMGNIGNNLEQMSNYAASRGKTLEQVVEAHGQRQFYGPLRRFHGDRGSGPLKRHERDAYYGPWTDAKQKAWDKASNEVFSGGSNRINYATDQGTVGDPNYDPNKMTNVGGNMFGIQPGTGKWVSAQRGKPQVEGPVTADAVKGQEAAAVAAAPAPDGEKVSWVKEDQGRVAGIRKGALSAETRSFLQRAGERHKLRADVYSGGQRMKGAPGHTGSHRHDQGGAGDLKLWDPEQKRYLNSNNPADAKRMEEYTASAVEFGATGVGHGHGYMGPESLHIGGGKTASWGGSEIANRALRKGIVQRARRKEEPPPTTVASDAPRERNKGRTEADVRRHLRGDRTQEDIDRPLHPEEPTKTRPSDDLIMASQRERDVNVNLKVNDSSMQFARASMRRSADREVREARWNSHSDIGAA